MVILIKIIQVILALSTLIIVHEFGHFLWAKIFKIRVEKFYLFFDVGGKAIARWKWGETEFGIGWLPFGGYCKVSGMVDESMDIKNLNQEPKEWEFRSKPAWQRLFVMAGGVVNNLIFAVLLYIAIMAIWGRSYIANEDSHIYASELAQEMGFKTGDKILSFDDYVPDNFAMLQADLARRDVHKARVLRGADTVELYIDQSMIADVLQSPLMFDLAIPFVIDSISQAGPNKESELAQGDKVIAIDGQRVEWLQDSRKILETLKNQEIVAEVIRGVDTLGVNVKIDSAGLMGVYMAMPTIKTKDYSLLEAIPAGLKLTGENISSYLQDLKLLATPSSGAYKSVGSFIAIGEVFPDTWDWYQFINLLALLSIMLGIINLIPIPGLDGGHIMFTLYEMVTGRKPSDKFLIVAQLIGMALIFALMFLAIGNDITRVLNF